MWGANYRLATLSSTAVRSNSRSLAEFWLAPMRALGARKQGQALIKNLPKGFDLGCRERYLTIRKTASKQSFNTFIARIDAYLETQAR